MFKFYHITKIITRYFLNYEGDTEKFLDKSRKDKNKQKNKF